MPYESWRLRAAILVAAASISASPAVACTVPNSVTNGQVADASKVMENFDAVAQCADEAVKPTGSPAAGAISVFSGTKTVTAGNLTGDVTTSGGTAATLSNSGVTAGTYINPNITVDAKGRITAASNGSGSGSAVRAAGTAFPSFPAAGDFFFRTDRGIEYYWDGNIWLSTQLFIVQVPLVHSSNYSATAGAQGRSVAPRYGHASIYVERVSLG